MWLKNVVDQGRYFSSDVFRNIVAIQSDADLFEDLTQGDPDLLETAVQVEKDSLEEINPAYKGFDYSKAIEYPFRTENFLRTRFADGTFPALYCSLELETTIYETAYHMARAEMAIEGVQDKKDPILRKREVFLIHCSGYLIDLTGKERDFPEIIADDYTTTNQIGRFVYNQGLPGILYSSARCTGTNLVSFKQEILNNPRSHCYLDYWFRPNEQKIEIVHCESTWFNILVKREEELKAES